MKLFLDDIRREPEGYVLVRSFEDCIFELGTKVYDTVSLDYALGERFTGLDVLKWMVRNQKFPQKLNIHSTHGWGRAEMACYIRMHFPKGYVFTMGAVKEWKERFSLALVTGAGGGIGRAISQKLDRRGSSLILVGRRLSTLEETTELLSKRPLLIEADLTDPVQCERVFQQVKTMPVDLLVNNAGFGLCGDFTETDEPREFSMLDLNVRAVQFFTKRFVRQFAEKDCGTVLNVASSAAFCRAREWRYTMRRKRISSV